MTILKDFASLESIDVKSKIMSGLQSTKIQRLAKPRGAFYILH